MAACCVLHAKARNRAERRAADRECPEAREKRKGRRRG